MSILVVFIHANNLAYYNFNGNDNTVVHVLVKVFAGILGGLAVPFFFMLSAYWLFRIEKDEKKEIITLNKRLKRKGKTVIIPYICWNTLGMCFYMLVTRIPFISNLMNSGSVIEISVENIVKGVFLHSFYFPFWYLKDLIVLFALSPVIFFVIKKKAIAIVSIFIIGGISILEIKLPIFQTESLLFFLIGGYLSVYQRGWFERINSGRGGYTFLWVICSVIRYFGDGTIVKMIFIISPILMWKALDTLLVKVMERYELSWFVKQSFFIYAVHVIPVTCVGHILAKVNGSNCGAAINYMLAPIITIGIIYIIAKIMNRYFRRVYSVLCGERG